MPTYRQPLSPPAIGVYGAVIVFLAFTPVVGFLADDRWGYLLWGGHLLVSLAVGALAAYGASCAQRELVRHKEGQCIGCGYDLRGSSDRCPECGRVIRQRVMPP